MIFSYLDSLFTKGITQFMTWLDQLFNGHLFKSSHQKQLQYMPHQNLQQLSLHHPNHHWFRLMAQSFTSLSPLLLDIL